MMMHCVPQNVGHIHTAGTHCPGCVPLRGPLPCSVGFNPRYGRESASSYHAHRRSFALPRDRSLCRDEAANCSTTCEGLVLPGSSCPTDARETVNSGASRGPCGRGGSSCEWSHSPTIPASHLISGLCEAFAPLSSKGNFGTVPLSPVTRGVWSRCWVSSSLRFAFPLKVQL